MGWGKGNEQKKKTMMMNELDITCTSAVSWGSDILLMFAVAAGPLV
jgi:hypothetical protein